MKYLLPLILIVISAGLFLLWIDPTYKDIQVVAEENQSYTKALERVAEVRDKRLQIQSVVNNIDASELDRLEKVLPGRINNIKLILDINNIADQNGMIISDIRISEENSGNEEGEGRSSIASSAQKYEAISFAFSVVTTYDNFKRFLNDISFSLRVVDVTSTTITPIDIAGEQSSVNDLYRFDVGIKTYWLESEKL